MNRRTFVKSVVAGSLLGTAGCLGYTRTTPSDYKIVRSGYTDGQAWIDVVYTGDEEGKVQYKLYISDSGSYVEESETEAEMLTPGETREVPRARWHGASPFGAARHRRRDLIPLDLPLRVGWN